MAAAAAPPASGEAEHPSNKSGTNAAASTQTTQQAENDPKAATDSSNQPAASEVDDFGLPIRPKLKRRGTVSSDEFQSADEGGSEAPGEEEVGDNGSEQKKQRKEGNPRIDISSSVAEAIGTCLKDKPANLEQKGELAATYGRTEISNAGPSSPNEHKDQVISSAAKSAQSTAAGPVSESKESSRDLQKGNEVLSSGDANATDKADKLDKSNEEGETSVNHPATPERVRKERSGSRGSSGSPTATRKLRSGSGTDAKEMGGVSEWSHQALAPPQEHVEEEEELKWQEMPTDSQMDYYDDFGHLVAKGDKQYNDDADFDPIKGGAGKGYTRVQLDDDAVSATSMDEHTSYLFKNKGGGTNLMDEEGDEEGRDATSQMQATKDLLTEGQRIAYVGVTRLSMEAMKKEMDRAKVTKKFKKDFQNATENLQMWSQKMMVRLYAHMDISSSEQVMIEQLAEHGIQPADMTPALMQNARIKNPLAEAEPEPKTTKANDSKRSGDKETVPESSVNAEVSPIPSDDSTKAPQPEEDAVGSYDHDEEVAEPPPPYTEEDQAQVPEVVDPLTLEEKETLDIDLRWTILCDLFLVLIGDSVYDARSRSLLEKVGEALDIPWLDICRFEKRITDALEMQEEAAREDWDEADHIEARRKKALKKKYLMMGLATAGGGLLIGLSAGILAPAIGAGLAAGFSAIGVAGTSGFLAGAGGVALITTSSAIAGGTIAINASSRRMGAVKTFEYRPLHNNKRVNLIITISGWMNGKVDDVRLPFSTVDPIMGDIYSLFFEPEMLTSMGDTIRILATEALTQGLQQILAATFLSALMAGLTAPLILSKLSYLIDNPWSSSLDRAERAGLILADSIIDRHLGVRPITLVGFSLGARVIFSCLKELANRGAYGMIQNVYIFGSPVIASKEEWLRIRTVISGRLVNGYASNDWILGYLFRATSGGLSRVAGLAPVEDVPGVENFSCSEIVNGHMAYRAAMPRLLRELGWEVISDEFSEIEDPDPENHESRQRELIQEIEEARQAAAEQPQKKRWWSNKKKEQKKGWETYDKRNVDEQLSTTGAAGRESSDGKGEFGNVLFDTDAILRELESEHMEVKQLESTLPPMQLDLNKPARPTVGEEDSASVKKSTDAGTPKSAGSRLNPFAALRGSKSYNSTSPSSSPSTTNNTKLTGKESKSNGISPKPDSATTNKSGNQSKPNLYDYDEDEDADPLHNGGGITMSFEPAGGAYHGSDEDDADWGSQRPPLKSSATMPAGLGIGSTDRDGDAGGGSGHDESNHGSRTSIGRSPVLEHNAWATDDHAHGGEEEEGEITMTFA